MTADQKLNAWQSVVAGSALPPNDLNAEEAAEWAMRYADRVQDGREQREREGRFGVEETQTLAGYASLKGWANPNAVKRMEKESADLQANRDEWMERAQRAEAEVGRLEAELIAKTDSAEALAHEWENAKQRAAKAESLLKEALGVLRKMPRIMRDLSVADVEAESEKVLTRARQEGFSDGE